MDREKRPRPDLSPAFQTERRRAPRFRAPGAQAWIAGAGLTPAAIVDLSAGGARLLPLLPLRKGQVVRVELRCNGSVLCRRSAVVTHSTGEVAGVAFRAA